MGTIEKLLIELSKFFQPLSTTIEDGQIDLLMAELGLNLPVSAGSNAAFQSVLSSINTNIRTTGVIVAELVKAIEEKNTGTTLSKSIEVITKIKSFTDDFTKIGNSIKNDIGAGAIGIPHAQLDSFVNDLPKNLFEFLVISNIENNLPALSSVLELLKVIERNEISTGNPALPAFTKRSLNLSEFSNSITNPSKQFSNHYDWGKPAFNGSKFFSAISKILLGTGIPALYDGINKPSELNLIFANIGVDSSDTSPGIFIEPTIEAHYLPNFSIKQPAWEFKIGFVPNLGQNAKVSVFPNGQTKFVAPAFTGGNISAEWLAGFSDRPFDILNIVGGSKIDARAFSIKIENKINSSGIGETKFEANLTKFRILIVLSGSDGFISKITSGSNIESEFDLRFGYSTASGVFIEGSGTIEIKLPLHINIGPIVVNGLTIGLGLGKDKIPLVVAASFKAELGPLKIVVEEIGIKADLSFPVYRNGNLGPVNLDFGFKPPNGLGLSLDTGIIKGGGYLNFDTDREEYAGALELIFSNWIALKAIGLITTKMPDGSKGFSMIILITAEFSGGLQLGFGFTLVGVGGLLGVNRKVNLNPLREGIKNGNVNSIMFPTDVIANAPKILSDMKAFFPVQEGQFLIGPMAKIGYGTPTLISISLGIIVEFPDVAITILGVIKVGLPTEEAAVLRLNVNFMGRVESDHLWFYAALYDSRILFITLEGEMGLLVRWGDQPDFVLTIGGFHPKYSPPAMPFAISQRLAVNILNESYAKVRIDAYFAVTSNTVQLGARAELFFGYDAFSVDGHIGFDVLFQFNPFYFNFSLSVSLSVKLFGMGLFTVGFSGLIEGPTPWHIKGHGSIGFLFFSVSVPFEHTWGETQKEILPSIELMPLIKTGYQKYRKVIISWSPSIKKMKAETQHWCFIH